MADVYKLFPYDEVSKWSQDFEKATKSNNKEEAIHLLKQANNVYLDEYCIYHALTCFSNNSFSDIEKDTLQKCKIVKSIEEEKHSLSISTTFHNIKAFKFSHIFSDVLNDKISKNNLVRRNSYYSSEYVSQVIPFPNQIVTGYIYGIADKAKTIHSWVEFKNKNNEEFVIDYTDNLIMNKEGYYYIRHAKPIKKVSSGSMKGKQQHSTGSLGNNFTNTSMVSPSQDAPEIADDVGEERE